MLQASRRGMKNEEFFAQSNISAQTSAVQDENVEVIPFEEDHEVATVTPQNDAYAEYFRSTARDKLMRDLVGGEDELAQKTNELLGFNTTSLDIVWVKMEGLSFVDRDGNNYNEIISQLRCGEAFWQAFDENNRPIRLYRKPRNDAELQQILQARGIEANLTLRDFTWRYMLYFDMPQKEDSGEDGSVRVYSINMAPTSGINFKNSYVKQLLRKKLMFNEVLTRMTISMQKKDRNNFYRLEFEALDIKTGKPLGVKTDGVK